MLLRALLLAVFFNTVIGMPLHAAGHLHGHLQAPTDAHPHAHESAGHGDDAAEAAPEGHAEAHAACVWCPAHAQLGMALACVAQAPLPPLALRSVFHDAAATAWLPAAERWRFAARDPPSMS